MQPNNETLTRLQALAPRGADIYTLIRHVSASGMTRRISIFVIHREQLRCLDYLIAKLGLYKRHKTSDGLVVTGCNMDMAYHVVSSLSNALYSDDYAFNYKPL